MLISHVIPAEKPTCDFPLLAQNVNDPNYAVLFIDRTTGTIVSHETALNIGKHINGFIPVDNEDAWRILPKESYVTIKVK